MYFFYKPASFHITDGNFSAVDEWLNELVHVVGGTEAKGAQLYHVQAIPANVLIDQQGIIVAKDLRGEGLLQKLAELLK